MARFVSWIFPANSLVVAIAAALLGIIGGDLLAVGVTLGSWILYSATSVAVVLVAFLILNLYAQFRVDNRDQLCSAKYFFAPRTYRCELVDTIEKQIELTKVASEIFKRDVPDDYITEDIWRANPRKSLILRNLHTREVEGYAACWPIRKETAATIADGSFAEQSLTAEHILPAKENKTAQFLLIPGLGVTDAESIRRGPVKSRAVLFQFFELLLTEFVVNDDFERTIIFLTHSVSGPNNRERPASQNLIKRLKEAGIDVGAKPGEIVDNYLKRDRVWTIVVDHTRLTSIYVKVMKETLGVSSIT